MIIPNAVKTNNRYRGPQESKKVDNMYLQAINNLNKIKEKLNYLDELKDNVIEKPKKLEAIRSNIYSMNNVMDNVIVNLNRDSERK